MARRTMRLTLRTLLAYLDDILDPVQTKEIGARISENSTASSLVARIRDVTRRRRIGSPELSGPGSSPDPNVVAEYLDNSLEPAAVADVERVCLDSDVHLAEVAACHQILTIVLGEPVTIRPELRERMYAMGSVSPSPTMGAPAASVPYAVGSAPPIAARPVVPDYLKRPPLWKKLVPLAAVAAVAAGWFYLVMTGGFFGDEKRDVAVNEPAAKKGVEAAAVTVADKKPVAAPAVIEQPVVAAIPMPMPMPLEATTTPPTEPAPMPQPAAADAAVAPAAVGAKPANADGAAVPPPPAAGITAPPAANGPTVDPPTIMYTSAEGVLLHRPRGRQDWTVLPRRALLHVGDELASPEPFVSDLQVSSPKDPALNLRVSLQGGARVRILPPTEMMLAEFELNRGRVAVYRGADGVQHAIGVGVLASGMRTEFDAVSPQTRFGLWVTLPQPKNGPPAPEAWPKPMGTLVVASGKVNVRRANLPPISGEEKVQSLEWTNPAVEGFAAEPGVPIWLDPEVRPLTSQKIWASSYEREFIPEGAVQNADLSVQNQIGPVAETDKRNTIATFATKTMALVDEVSTLVRVLTSPHEEARGAAITGLREWVMMSPENAPRLEQEVNRGFRDQEAVVVTKLLWGLTDKDAHDEAVSMQVVEWLNSDNIAIRELAFLSAFSLAHRDLGYRPQNPEGQREPAIMRWRELVKRNKGLVPTVAEQMP